MPLGAGAEAEISPRDMPSLSPVQLRIARHHSGVGIFGTLIWRVEITASSICPDLPQLLVIHAKIVSYLVAEDTMDSVAHFLRSTAVRQDRPPVYADLVRKDQIVVVASLGKRHAVVEAEKLRWMIYPSVLHSLPVRPVLDNYVHVVYPIPEVFRKSVQGLGHEFLKGNPSHGERIITPNLKASKRALHDTGRGTSEAF